MVGGVEFLLKRKGFETELIESSFLTALKVLQECGEPLTSPLRSLSVRREHVVLTFSVEVQQVQC